MSLTSEETRSARWDCDSGGVERFRAVDRGRRRPGPEGGTATLFISVPPFRGDANAVHRPEDPAGPDPIVPQQRRLTVVNCYRGHGDVPEIRMGGNWLTRAGFPASSKLAILVTPGHLIVKVVAPPGMPPAHFVRETGSPYCLCEVCTRGPRRMPRAKRPNATASRGGSRTPPRHLQNESHLTDRAPIRLIWSPPARSYNPSGDRCGSLSHGILAHPVNSRVRGPLCA
jgi:Toxin SymE, type I toxin-antitoxin system